MLVGARPRTKGMERGDLLEANGAIFTVQGRALDECASRDVRVLVVDDEVDLAAALAKGLRRGAVLSGVAVASTGLAVSGGVVLDGDDVSTAAAAASLSGGVVEEPLTVDAERAAELEARRDGWTPNEPKYTKGVLGKYAKVVQSAAHGAVCS